MDDGLKSFLKEFAHTRVRFDVLSYFVRNAGSFLSTEDLAVKIGRDPEQTREAVMALHASGIVLYTPFGYSDICFLDGDKHTPDMARNLRLLVEALNGSPMEIENFLKSLS